MVRKPLRTWVTQSGVFVVDGTYEFVGVFEEPVSLGLFYCSAIAEYSWYGGKTIYFTTNVARRGAMLMFSPRDNKCLLFQETRDEGFHQESNLTGLWRHIKIGGLQPSHFYRPHWISDGRWTTAQVDLWDGEQEIILQGPVGNLECYRVFTTNERRGIIGLSVGVRLLNGDALRLIAMYF